MFGQIFDLLKNNVLFIGRIIFYQLIFL